MNPNVSALLDSKSQEIFTKAIEKSIMTQMPCLQMTNFNWEQERNGACLFRAIVGNVNKQRSVVGIIINNREGRERGTLIPKAFIRLRQIPNQVEFTNYYQDFEIEVSVTTSFTSGSESFSFNLSSFYTKFGHIDINHDDNRNVAWLNENVENVKMCMNEYTVWCEYFIV